MACTTYLICLFNIVIGCSQKKKKNQKSLEDVSLVAGTLQNLSNLYSLDIYECAHQIDTCMVNIGLVQIISVIDKRTSLLCPFYRAGFGIIWKKPGKKEQSN